MSLFRTKPVEKIIAESKERGEGTLKRTLGAWSLVALGVGAIVGTGIFVLTGQAAAKHAGPAVVVAGDDGNRGAWGAARVLAIV